MKVKHFIIWAVLLIAASAKPAYCGIKFDISATTGKVTETVSEWGGKAQKMMDENATLQTLILYGKAAKEAAANLKEMKDAATGAVSSVTSAANQVKNDAMGAVGDTVGEVNGAVGAATGAVGNVAGSAAAKAQSAQELLKLQNERKEIEATMQQEIESEKAVITGKISILQENNKKLQEMIAQDASKKAEYDGMIESNKKQITQYYDDSAALMSQVSSKYSSQLQALDEQISAVKAKAAEEAMSGATSAVKGLLGKDDSAAELNAMISENFIPAGEAQTADSINRVMANRKVTEFYDTINGMNMALTIKKDLDASTAKSDETKGKVITSEGASSGTTMDIELVVNNMRALVKYTKLLVADMKMRTSTDLASMTIYKVRNPEKDVTQFNLDDYKYKKSKCTKDGKSKFSLDNIKDTAKKAKGKISQYKGYVKDAKEYYALGKDAVGALQSEFGGSSPASYTPGTGFQGDTGETDPSEYAPADNSVIDEEETEEYILPDGENAVEEDEEPENEVGPKTEGDYEAEARARALGYVNVEAMMQDEYEKAAREAGSAGVASDFKAQGKVAVDGQEGSAEGTNRAEQTAAAVKAEGASALKSNLKEVKPSSSRKSFGTPKKAENAGEKK